MLFGCVVYFMYIMLFFYVILLTKIEMSIRYFSLKITCMLLMFMNFSVRLIYRVGPAIVNLIFIQIAKKWEGLLTQWGEIEQDMNEFGSTLHIHKTIKYIIQSYLLFCTGNIM